MGRLIRRRVWLLTHKWLGIGTGVVLAAWLGSGLVLLLPRPRAGGSPPVGPRLTDYGIPPSAAAAAAGRVRGVAPAGVGLTQVGDEMTWLVTFDTADPVLVDAVDGAPVTLDLARAERIARGTLPPEVPVLERETLAPGDGTTPRGGYRFRFGDGGATIAVVDGATGAVRWSTRHSRLYGVFADIHHVAPLRAAGALVHGWVILIASLCILVGLGTGYFIGWPRRRHRAAETA